MMLRCADYRIDAQYRLRRSSLRAVFLQCCPLPERSEFYNLWLRRTRVLLEAAMRASSLLMALLLAVSATTSVNGQTAIDSATIQVKQTTFAPWLHVDLEHSRQTLSGTFVRDVVEGRGGPPPENMRGAQIALRLWLADGTPIINPARDPKVLQPPAQPVGGVSFVVNRHEVMPGLEEGVRGMRPGGVRQLVIPSSAGFGATGRMTVPPNAVLVAEVKLLMAAYDPVR